MRTAITTRFLSPTNHRGSRVVATAKRGQRQIFDWRHDLNVEENHRRAARKLATYLGWCGHWAGGGTETGYVFVLAESEGFVVEEPETIRFPEVAA